MSSTQLNRETQRLSDMLKARKLKAAVAESLTGGAFQSALTRMSGATDIFEGGMTCYTLESKVNLLGVNRKLAEYNECVCQAVADQMAQNVSAEFGTEIGISTTGWIDSPALGSDGEPIPPYFYFAVYIDDGTTGETTLQGLRTLKASSREERQMEAVLLVVQEIISFMEKK